MGQVEFALVTSVVLTYLIFTPERLVLLRNLILWAIGTWMAWHGFDVWQRSTWAKNITAAFGTGHSLSEISGLVQNEISRACFDWATIRVANIRQEGIRISIGAFNWLRSLLELTPVNHSTISDEHKPPSSIPISSSSPSTQAAPTLAPAPLQNSQYYAILVTTPPVHVYGVISDNFCTPPDRPSRVPWNSTGTHLLPPMLASLVFRRHFALCLVLKEVWESKSKTLAEKFDNQLFWDYCGDEIQNSRAISWSPCRIAEINAIEDLGIVVLDGDATDLCTRRYIQLRSSWRYRNIWWNDADFALILAYLSFEGIAAPKCTALMHRLGELREIEVTRPRAQANQKTLAAGAATFIGSLVLTAVTGGATLPVTGPAIIGSFGIVMGSSIAEDALKKGENGWRKRREKAKATLQGRFPTLRGLFS